jgi:hypothetical protein
MRVAKLGPRQRHERERGEYDKYLEDEVLPRLHRELLDEDG